VLFSETWEEHFEHLCSILLCLRWSDLTAKPIRYATPGHEVGQNLNAVEELPVSLNKTQMTAFLGFYSKFLPNYASVAIPLSDLAIPLSDLTKNNAPNKVVWTEQCQQAQQKL